VRFARAAVVGLLATGAMALGGEPPKPQDQRARIVELCKRLGRGQYGDMAACQELVAIGQPAVPYLIEALKDRRPQARWWAVAAVCRIAADEAYQAVLDVLHNDPDAFVRSTAVYYLRHYRKKGKNIWPEVEKALWDKHPEVGRWALRLMIEDGYEKAGERLREVLARGSSELRSYALAHVREMGDKGKAYLPLVRQLLKAEDPRVRYDAIHTCVVLMDSGQLDFLRQTYERDPDPIVREACLRCITVIPEPPVEGIELFLKGLESEDEKVRKVAAQLLRKGCKQYFGYDARQPLPIREHAIKKWRAWYEANKAKLQWHPDLRKFLLPGQRPPKTGEAK